MGKTILKTKSENVSDQNELENDENLLDGLLSLNPQSFKTFFERSGSKVKSVRIN